MPKESTPTKRQIICFQPSPDARRALSRTMRNRRVPRTRVINEAIVATYGQKEAKAA
jgi:hypothetical protein